MSRSQSRSLTRPVLMEYFSTVAAWPICRVIGFSFSHESSICHHPATLAVPVHLELGCMGLPDICTCFLLESAEKVGWATHTRPLRCLTLRFLAFCCPISSSTAFSLPQPHISQCVWCNEWPARLPTQARSSEKVRVLLRALPLPRLTPSPPLRPHSC